jgi:hypothetical protein
MTRPMIYYSLENNPPIPISATESYKSFHDFCGLDYERHITILSLRDQADVRVMPANGVDTACVNCIRGVRRVSICHIQLVYKKFFIFN